MTKTFCIKIWLALLTLLFVSLYLGSHGERVLATTLIFGIATLKAFLVAAYYMGLRWEPKWITAILLTGVVFMVILYIGLIPDIVYGTSKNYPSTLLVNSFGPASRILTCNKGRSCSPLEPHRIRWELEGERYLPRIKRTSGLASVSKSIASYLGSF